MLAVIPVSGLLVLGSTATSQAFFTPDVIEQIDHFVECFGWMITDPELHQANCSPANVVWPRDSGGGSGDGAAPPVIVTPPGPDDGNEDGNDGAGGIV